MSKKKYEAFEALFAKADAAGMAAGTGAKPTPMVVGTPTTLFGSKIDYSKPVEVVEGGVCGFAWIKVRPGTSSFAKWLVKSGKCPGAAYSGGVDIWVSKFGQSMERKEAYASAFAKVLSEAGITAYADSRMD